MRATAIRTSVFFSSPELTSLSSVASP